MIINKLKKELETALEKDDSFRYETIKLVLTAVKDYEISLKIKEQDTYVGDTKTKIILKSIIDQIKNSISSIDKESECFHKKFSQIKIIKEFIPECSCNKHQIYHLVNEAIKDTGASDIDDIKSIMDYFYMHKYDAKFDMKLITEAVKEKLSRVD